MVDGLALTQLVPVVHRRARAVRERHQERGERTVREVPVNPPGRA